MPLREVCCGTAVCGSTWICRLFLSRNLAITECGRVSCCHSLHNNWTCLHWPWIHSELAWARHLYLHAIFYCEASNIATKHSAFQTDFSCSEAIEWSEMQLKSNDRGSKSTTRIFSEKTTQKKLLLEHYKMCWLRRYGMKVITDEAAGVRYGIRAHYPLWPFNTYQYKNCSCHSAVDQYLVLCRDPEELSHQEWTQGFVWHCFKVITIALVSERLLGLIYGSIHRYWGC